MNRTRSSRATTWLGSQGDESAAKWEAVTIVPHPRPLPMLLIEQETRLRPKYHLG